MSTVLEAAAIMGWFAVLVVGEKFLNDGTTARRTVEGAAQQTVAASAMSYCSGDGLAAQDVGGPAPHGGAQSSTNGTLQIGGILSAFEGLGFGSQPTFSLYSDPLQKTTADATAGGVHADPLVASGSYDFEATRALACIERPKDSPTPNIAAYRTTIFDLNIRGY